MLLCRAADRIDGVADALTAAVGDLLPSHRVFRATFAIIDPMMVAWHAVRLIVARLPVHTHQAACAKSKLLGPNEGDAVGFSALFVPAPVLTQLVGKG